MSQSKDSQYCGVNIAQYQSSPLIHLVNHYDDKIIRKIGDKNNRTHIFSHAKQNGYTITYPKNIDKLVKKNQSKKNKVSAVRIWSPEQLVLKAQRRAYERKIEQNSAQFCPQQQKIVSKNFNKMKANQQQRRKEKLLLIKAFKYELYHIFGSLIFTRRWKISRQQIADALGIFLSSINFKQLQQTINDRINQRFKKVAQKLGDHRRMNYLYRNPFRTLMRHNVVDYANKLWNSDKQKRNKIKTKQLKMSKQGKMTREGVYLSFQTKPNMKKVTAQAIEQIQIIEKNIKYEQDTDEDEQIIVQ